jgi:chromate reductase
LPGLAGTLGTVMDTPLRVLLISGSLRSRSTNTAVLRTAAAVAPDGVETALYERLGDLPHFNPDNEAEPLHPEVVYLRAAIRRADAVLFSTPEYAGALPGSFKNLLDWTIGDDRPGSISEKSVAWVNSSPRGAANAHSSLRTVLGFAGATVVEAACVEIPVTGSMVGTDGLVADTSVSRRVAVALGDLADVARPVRAR